MDINEYTAENLRPISDFTIDSYIKFVMPIALDIEASTGIFHMVPIVQSAHESRNGNSGLARLHCNCFGITATDHWRKKGGLIVNMPTFEYINGHRVDMNREFRGYPSWRESFQDWAGLITGLNVYKKAYDLFKHENTVIDGFKALCPESGEGYATDPAYAKSLIAIYSSVMK